MMPWKDVVFSDSFILAFLIALFSMEALSDPRVFSEFPLRCPLIEIPIGFLAFLLGFYVILEGRRRI